MKSLLDSKYRNRISFLTEKVRQMGYEEMANEMQNITQQPKIAKNSNSNPRNDAKNGTKEDAKNYAQQQTVPFFYDNVAPQIDKNNPFLINFLKSRYFSFRERTNIQMSSINDIIAEIGIENFEYDQKKFDKISKIFGEPRNRIFLPVVLENFVNDANQFETDKYIDFVKCIIKVQLALFMIYTTDLIIEKGISESHLCEFVRQYAATIRKLSPLQEDLDWYMQFYEQAVTSRFLFQISSINDTKVDIKALVTSVIFFQFINLDSISKRDIRPFTIKNTTKTYNMFIDLDTIGLGYLNAKSIKKFDGYHFTNAFTKRVFEIMPTFEQNMDFALFLKLVYPLKDMRTSQATHFFFRVLDLDGDGVISRPDINYFYKAMVKESNIKNHDYDSFLAKLLDIVGCQTEFVSEDDLLDSDNQDLFFKLLIDIKTFNDWEQQNEDEDIELNEEEEEEDQNDDQE
ncbi:EF hand family protein [Tritrichomonas foetus]|uniref:EF hand family protein n=1 Tax=Tritrichomonas foetus TaxID=1144522 RepID=A0A1J4IZ63_9EUKA|nr:EF hand family protein [Tritrichomonas foetus]|eukprot:OHS92702.1 EF hand family protein [Tritrichomonas foetus]